MFEKEFQEWFERNKKWLYSSDHLQAAYHAWCAGIQQQQAAQQSVQPTDGSLCKDCGHPVEIKQVAGCLDHPVIG